MRGGSGSFSELPLAGVRRGVKIVVSLARHSFSPRFGRPTSVSPQAQSAAYNGYVRSEIRTGLGPWAR